MTDTPISEDPLNNIQVKLWANRYGGLVVEGGTDVEITFAGVLTLATNGDTPPSNHEEILMEAANSDGWLRDLVQYYLVDGFWLTLEEYKNSAMTQGESRLPFLVVPGQDIANPASLPALAMVINDSGDYDFDLDNDWESHLKRRISDMHSWTLIRPFGMPGVWRWSIKGLLYTDGMPSE